MAENTIRILQVLGGMNQGGTENFLMNLYRNIDRKKIQFDFLVNRKGNFDKEIEKLGGRIYYIPALQKIGQVAYVKKLDNFLKQHTEYKIIHSHLNQVTGLILERAKKFNIPVRIAHSHNSGFPKNIIKRIYKNYLGSKILDNATLLLGCSDKANKWLYKDQSNKALIINNGVEIYKFKYNDEKRKKIRKELNIKENEIVIGHVGRFSSQKNHKFLIKIFKKYSEKNENARLLLVGDGKLKKQIEKMIKKYDIDQKVIMTGNRNDISQIYQAIDLFVFPSLYEGLPLVLIEAQISGLSILASSTITNMVDVTGNVKFLNIRRDT